MALPTELVDSLNQIYFLHLLVNDKDKVVPPGKSVLSMLMHANFRLQQESDTPADLVERVKAAAHKAFWREATEVLSSPMPFVQLPRLKRLYLDIHEALGPLFPPNHHILMTLAAPPPPTSSPLLSTVNILKEILIALRERCAPVRDEQTDTLLSTMSFLPASVQYPTTPSLGNTPPESSELRISPIAQFVIDNIKAILSLADDMKSDLNNFILGSMTEEELMNVLSTEVESREREFVLNLWGGKEEIRGLWLSWSREISRQNNAFEFANYRWVDRLFKGLEADKPVFCVPPEDIFAIQNGASKPMTNNLPPQLFFVSPALVYLQNYLQAIVITAALQILARPPHSAIKSPSFIPPSNDPDLGRDFVQHIWSLLRAEIDSDSIENPSFDGRLATTSNSIPETKLVNLADEVVREHRMFGSGSPNPVEEKRLRDAVDRTLRTSDPVFLVLRKRLFDALEEKLLGALVNIQDAGHSTKLAIPEKMQTGRGPPTGSQKQVVGLAGVVATRGSSSSNSRLKALIEGAQGAKARVRFEVLGFEHTVLRDAVANAYEKLTRCIIWTESVWGNDWNEHP